MLIAHIKTIKPAYKITAAYLFAGVIWILFSDRVLAMLAADVEGFVFFQTVKGWFFVAVTSVLLFGLISRSFSKVDRRKAFEALLKSEAALKQSQLQLTNLMASLPGMVYRCLPDRDWTIIFASQGCLELTGYPPEALINNAVISYGNVIYPADRQRVWEEMQKKLFQKNPFPLTYRIVSASGQVKWVWEQAQGIIDEQGKLCFIEGYITDITQRLKAENSLKEYNSLMRSLLENLSFPVFYKDLKGRILGCNLKYCEFLGKPYGDIIGKTAWEFTTEKEAYRIEQTDKQVLETMKDFRSHEKIVFPDGRELDTMYHKSLFYNAEGVPRGFIGFYFDISERIRAEQVIKKNLEDLERINNELEQFTYSVSHDLRSPLVTIKGSLKLLRSDIASNSIDEAGKGLQLIEGATQRMHHLLENLLALSRIGRIVNPFSEFSMQELANETGQYLKGILTESGAVYSVSEDLPVVWGDRWRIGEVLQNLVENSVKFRNPLQPLHIEVGSRLTESGLVFFVKDNGIGILPEHQHLVFGLFKRFEAVGGGSGLGLTLVKRIIEYHGGQVWVESEGRGHGATICFSLNSQRHQSA